MPVPGQSSVFSVALQSGKYHPDIPFKGTLVAAHSWFRTRAPRVGLGVQDMTQTFPLETGGPIVPTGAFKAGQFGQGDVDLIPRAENFIGLLLYGALGAVETGADEVWDSATNQFVAGESGVNTHRFTFNPAVTFGLPWLALRTMTPGATAAENFGQVHQSAQVNNFRLDIPAAGLLGMTVGFTSLKVNFPLSAEVNSWTYANTAEDDTSAVHAGRGRFLIGGERQPISAATIEFMNGLQPQMIIGQYHPDDIVNLTRGMSIRITFRWENADFYRKLLTGSETEEDWDAIPFKQITSGAAKAFEAAFESPTKIPGTDSHYALRIIANKIVWQIDRAGLEMRAGSVLEVPYIGTVLEPEPGDEYIEMFLVNDSTYTVPTAGFLPPVVTVPASASYTGTDITLAPAATVADYDSTDFAGGVMSITLGGAGYDAGADQVNLGAGVSISGGNFLVGATAIGTTAASAGDPAISVTLNAEATPALIQTALRNLLYGTLTDTSRAPAVVTATIVVNDGDGGVSTSVITITHA